MPQNAPLSLYLSRASTDSEPGPVNGERQGGHTEDEGVLISATRDEEALPDMHAEGSNKHHTEDDRCRKRREQPERHKETTPGLSQARHQRMAPPRHEPDHLEELTGGVKPVPPNQPNNFCVPCAARVNPTVSRRMSSPMSI